MVITHNMIVDMDIRYSASLHSTIRTLHIPAFGSQTIFQTVESTEHTRYPTELLQL